MTIIWANFNFWFLTLPMRRFPLHLISLRGAAFMFKIGLNACLNWGQSSLLPQKRSLKPDWVALMERNMTVNMTVSAVNMVLAMRSKWLELGCNWAWRESNTDRHTSSSVSHLLKPILCTVPAALFYLQHVYRLISPQWKWAHAAHCDYTLVFIGLPH